MRISRRAFTIGAVASGAVLAALRPARAQQPGPAPAVPAVPLPAIDPDAPEEFTLQPIEVDAAGNAYPSLAGVSPYEPLRPEWEPSTALPALPALPTHLAAFVERAVTYRAARAGWSSTAYGYDNRKLGVVNHIPVCDTLSQLDNYFTGGANAGLTHYGVGREMAGTLEITALDGSRWRIPYAPVSQYLPLVGPYAPWAQGRVSTGGGCAVPAHPIASRLGSGVPNGAYISLENVARVGGQGMSDPQINSNVFLRAAMAAYFGHAITPDTQVWHAGIDRIDRCSDTGWPGGYSGGLEMECQTAARALLAGDPSRLRGAVRIGAPPVASPVWQDEAWRAMVYTQERNDRLAIVAAVRQQTDRARELAVNTQPPPDWEQVAKATWDDLLQRADWDIAAAVAVRDGARAQRQRLG
jgi:hypothetical protein